MQRTCILIAVFMFLGARSNAFDESWQPAMTAAQWNILHSPGMPGHLLQDGDGWRFSFPQYGGPLPCEDICPGVHYITTAAEGPLRGQSLTMTVEIIGAAAFEYRLEPENTCSGTATVRLFIQRRDDDLTKDSHRWWSNPDAITLTPGVHTISVPLTPDRWSNVSGRTGSAARQEFYMALREAQNIGMTFGGGCFFGHGVNISRGQSTFALRHYAIMR